MRTRYSDIQRCPYRIPAPAHYRSNGNCRCDDPFHAEMQERGYEWNREAGVWNGKRGDARDGPGTNGSFYEKGEHRKTKRVNAETLTALRRKYHYATRATKKRTKP